MTMPAGRLDQLKELVRTGALRISRIDARGYAVRVVFSDGQSVEVNVEEAQELQRAIPH
jgi:hypothetical protein